MIYVLPNLQAAALQNNENVAKTTSKELTVIPKKSLETVQESEEDEIKVLDETWNVCENGF